ncbi:MAG TPA: peptidoglycan DD-metalloendopeptidase family protein [Candidatus Dormibacteraeota bacterium]|nr:peptidoglycan DD-metalloendopeptidase family protein [Candidatus Dormibacteraeota bacterium]
MNLVPKAMRAVVLILTVAFLLLSAPPVQAASALPPGHQPGKYTRWFYPSQVSYGPIEDGNGNTGVAPARGAFLTLPFMGPHYITSLFSHCYPDYGNYSQVCRYDGTVASASVGGPDPDFTAGFAQTPGGHDYLYYAGHDGYDYGLWYEPVAAAAPGRVILANWLVPGCETCLSGKTVEIDHGNGLLTFYGHLSRIDVSKGQVVARGQVIGISGMTGTATGPHLHFGVYNIHRSQTPVDPYGWSGSYPDPYSWDQGDLWLGGSPRFASIQMPSVTLAANLQPDDPTAINVSWSSPGDMRFAIYVVTQDGVRRTWTSMQGNGAATFHGKPGQSYWFWANATSNLGWTDAGGSAVVRLPHQSHGEAST